MRGLNNQFMKELSEGILFPFLERVKCDHSLCLEIRDDYINIYYRGGNLLRLEISNSTYNTFFDNNYTKASNQSLVAQLPPSQIQSSQDVQDWLEIFPFLKQAMDLYLGEYRKEEREAQQLIIRANNFGRESRATDYYICDVEYAVPGGCFDLVGVHWPSTSAERRKASERRLVFVEVKYGDSAIQGKAGLRKHIIDINQFIAEQSNLERLKREMVCVFNQKRELGLVNCGNDLSSFSDEPPMLLLLLCDHDPAKTHLQKAIQSLPPCPHAEIYLATGCLMGYGLFEQGVYRLGDALLQIGDYI